MSFQKASDLLRLAEMASARHFGIGLQEITEEFGCDHRTAQRMTRALEDCFPNVETLTDEQRRKYWRLKGGDAQLLKVQGIRDSELAALELAIRRAERDGVQTEVAALQSLRDRLLATMPRPHARRAEADAETVLEAYGFASRPGPHVKADPVVIATVAEALKGSHPLVITYAGGSDPGRERVLEPHGLLIGTRRYLVARERGGNGRLQHFRLDRIRSARIEAQAFSRDPDFNLEDHAARAFGSYHDDAEHGEVIWRFRPEAAPVAREFQFHPRQEVTEEADGALTVRFHASGQLEMAWHLYLWGDKVEVLAPDRLRDLVQGFQRGDFPALP
ncbi:helix-turn-helix transcriptional regulator [Neotabrizicola shimadae]|uniref:WYL domain-containing protein n=1 Tax=Neotabrizicola shimadae TaxID=2807096 RepID=A0A8G1EBM4_9RHOB|nr:WYL domain-containing protein [Neotabrizicola shimadae]QYZ68291.1 WYL domain-containing protein [Neotabrizicola shimadae]